MRWRSTSAKVAVALVAICTAKLAVKALTEQQIQAKHVRKRILNNE
jgi:hypothetical protein